MEKVLRSVFSASQNNPQQITGGIKFPLSISLAEIKTFQVTDVRIAGWGPLFSLILLISLGTGILLVIRQRGKSLAGWGLILLITATMLLNPEAWWARYAPQFWLIPVVVLVMALWHKDDRTVRIFGYLIMAVCIVNVFLISGANFADNFIDSNNMKETLQEISANGDEILVYYGKMYATEYKLNEFNIPYTVVSNQELLPCPHAFGRGVLYSLIDCLEVPF
jgi:hypothetical protein